MKKYIAPYEKSSKATENRWALYLAELFIATSSAAATYLMAFQSPINNGIPRKTFETFSQLFSQLFSDTHLYVENEDNAGVVQGIKQYLSDMSRRTTNYIMPRNAQTRKMYDLYFKYNEELQRSPLMDLIKKAVVFRDEGT